MIESLRRVPLSFHTASMEDEDRPIADLIGHHFEISTKCQCTRVATFSAESADLTFGAGATLRTMAARLRCKDCHERPALYLGLRWGYSDGRDLRKDPPPRPDWASRLMKRKPG